MANIVERTADPYAPRSSEEMTNIVEDTIDLVAMFHAGLVQQAF